MRVAAFFLCLCFLLLKGDSPAYAGTQHNRSYTALAQQIDQNQPVHLAAIYQDRVVTAHPESDVKMEYVFNDDVEDDDSNDFSSKGRLPARNHPVHAYLSHPSTFNYLFNYFKDPQSFWGQVSDKCIFQRVLRL